MVAPRAVEVSKHILYEIIYFVSISWELGFTPSFKIDMHFNVKLKVSLIGIDFSDT